MIMLLQLLSILLSLFLRATMHYLSSIPKVAFFKKPPLMPWFCSVLYCNKANTYNVDGGYGMIRLYNFFIAHNNSVSGLFRT